MLLWHCAHAGWHLTVCQHWDSRRVRVGSEMQWREVGSGQCPLYTLADIELCRLNWWRQSLSYSATANIWFFPPVLYLPPGLCFPLGWFCFPQDSVFPRNSVFFIFSQDLAFSPGLCFPPGLSFPPGICFPPSLRTFVPACVRMYVRTYVRTYVCT